MTNDLGILSRILVSLCPLLLAFTTCIQPLFAMSSAPPPNSAAPVSNARIQTINPETTAGMQAIFQTLDYDWMQFEEGVPLFILESIPRDINNSVSIVAKKHAFFMGLLPMILLANQEIMVEQEEVLLILDRHRSRKEEIGDQERIREISKRYGLRGRPLTDHRARARLLLRIDTIPPSLVLAQAANESAWGTSRFARLGNNLFGEWTFTPGTGIVPAGRPQGEIYEVRKFSSIYESIRSYMNNLNRHGAYRKLREIRADLKKTGQPVTGTALAKGLQKYSQRGEEYIQEISAMIRHNKLAQTEVAFLRQKKTETLTNISSSGGGFFSTRNKLIGHRTTARTNP